MADLVDIVRRGTDAFNNRDEAAAREIMADNVRMRAPGMPETTGVDAAVQFDKVWWDACSDAHADDQQVVAAGDDKVLVLGIFTGTHDGVLRTPMGEIPATGKALTGNYAWLFRFEGEKVAEAEILFDRMQVMEQLGMAPAGAPA